jgi:predicted nucleotidyltransferase
VATSTPVLKRLFSSGLRVKMLSHFFLHPGESAYVRELAGSLGESPGTVTRELTNLQEAGVLRSEKIGNQRHYSLDATCPILEDLRSMFLKTTAAGDGLRKALAGLDGVEVAFIYGSFARGDAHGNSDIDLMVVGDVGDRELAPLVARVEKRLHREINYTAYTRAEALRRLGKKGDFIHEVFSGPRIVLIGKADDRLLGAS